MGKAGYRSASEQGGPFRKNSAWTQEAASSTRERVRRFSVQVFDFGPHFKKKNESANFIKFKSGGDARTPKPHPASGDDPGASHPKRMGIKRPDPVP